MKISNYIKKYEDLTSLASNASRSLAFAGIAIVWIFNITAESHTQLPRDLFLPLLCFAITLGFDLFHYAFGGVAYYIFYIRMKNKNINESDKEVKYRKRINFVSWILYGIKIISVLLGYIYLIGFLVYEIKFI